MVRSTGTLVFVCGLAAVACATGSTEQPPGVGLPAEDGGDTETDDPTTFGPINPTTGLTTLGSSGDSGDSGDSGTDALDSDTGASGESCGNGAIDPQEKCDGEELGADDCLSQGFDEGTLACAMDCAAFDTSACIGYACGNDMIEGEEVCDGTELAGADCESEGFDVGELACDRDCGALNTDDCVLFSCGNDAVEGTETCDGSDLNDQDCNSQGHEGGTLTCADNCMGFDLSACSCTEQDIGSTQGVAAGSGSTVGEDDSLAIGCGDGGGADRVIAFTAPSTGDYVFDTDGSSFDTTLAVFDSCDEDSELACDDDSGSGATSTLSVTLLSGQSVVVVVDGYGDDTGNWLLNINAVSNDCDEEDIMSTVGASVTTGTTVGDDEDFDLSCGGAAGSVDHVIRFSSPATDSFTFDTVGSDFDTVLAALDTCDADSSLACNDDTVGTMSEVTVDLVQGQEIFLVISGYDGETGSFVLNVAQG